MSCPEFGPSGAKTGSTIHPLTEKESDVAKNEERDQRETVEAELSFGRRSLLTGSAAVAGAGLLAAGAAGVAPQREAIAATGEKRTMIWVVHEIGVWNLPLDVAFHDVAKMAGWEFQKVASQPAFTVEGMTKDITAAIQAKPDVLIVTMPGDGILPTPEGGAGLGGLPGDPPRVQRDPGPRGDAGTTSRGSRARFPQSRAVP